MPRPRCARSRTAENVAALVGDPMRLELLRRDHRGRQPGDRPAWSPLEGHLIDELVPRPSSGEKGCTTCTRACPRFRAWEPAADMHLFGRVREPNEMSGIWRQLLLTRAANDEEHTKGQDGGGYVSAMLNWLFDHDYIDAAMVSGVEPDECVESQAGAGAQQGRGAGHRRQPLPYRANPLALRQAKEEGLERLALVGMGCQTSSPPIMWDRKAGKVSKPFQFNIGLLCSKTFDDAIFEELFEAKYGLKKQDMVKMNIKGVFQIWMKDGSYHEVNLKECHQWTRAGARTAPTSPPSTPTSPPAASARTTTGR